MGKQKTGALGLIYRTAYGLIPKNTKHNRLWYKEAFEYFLSLTTLINIAAFWVLLTRQIPTINKLVIIGPLFIFEVYIVYVYTSILKKLHRDQEAKRTRTYKYRIFWLCLIEVVLLAIAYWCLCINNLSLKITISLLTIVIGSITIPPLIQQRIFRKKISFDSFFRENDLFVFNGFLPKKSSDKKIVYIFKKVKKKRSENTFFLGKQYRVLEESCKISFEGTNDLTFKEDTIYRVRKITPNPDDTAYRWHFVFEISTQIRLSDVN